MLNLENSYMLSSSRNAQLTWVDKPQMKIIIFYNYKHWYIIHTWSDKAFKCTVVNRAITNWGSPKNKITLQVKKAKKIAKNRFFQMEKADVYANVSQITFFKWSILVYHFEIAKNKYSSMCDYLFSLFYLELEWRHMVFKFLRNM